MSDDDLHRLAEGTHARLHERLGAQLLDGGVSFAVWAPNARSAAVIGDWNGWDARRDVMLPAGGGVWRALIRGIGDGARYKLRLVGPAGEELDKADPFAFRSEIPPGTASVVSRLAYEWQDDSWLALRAAADASREPWSIYEVHLGSWRREGDRPLSYRQTAPLLAEHALRHGFTHVELMPVMEHPFYGSWGYQTTGYFSPTARYGPPEDLMYLIDHLHGRGIGVILDWVPSHFPADAHGLASFDGTHLYEHEDRRQRVHPDWGSHIFNYDRHEVRAFLLSSADFWLGRYHADGLRVDAVASMLRLDYSREPGTWVPNRYGGRENLGAIELLRDLTRHVRGTYPGVETIAEESHAWPDVSRPTQAGGLGFGMKWDLGWMHDTLDHLGRDPVHRSGHQTELTFRTMYAFSESFVLPLSHDEVANAKGSLLDRFPGDAWQKLATLRLLFAYQHAQPGKKLLFQGTELGQWREWHHDRSLDWHLLDDPAHAGIARCVGDLNRLYRAEQALHELDFEPAGFEWADPGETIPGALGILRHPAGRAPSVLAVLNFTPLVRHGYRLGVDAAGPWREVLNTDALEYGGSGVGNAGLVATTPVPWRGRSHSLELVLPPLAAIFLRAPERDPGE